MMLASDPKLIFLTGDGNYRLCETPELQPRFWIISIDFLFSLYKEAYLTLLCMEEMNIILQILGWFQVSKIYQYFTWINSRREGQVSVECLFQWLLLCKVNFWFSDLIKYVGYSAVLAPPRPILSISDLSSSYSGNIPVMVRPAGNIENHSPSSSGKHLPLK